MKRGFAKFDEQAIELIPGPCHSEAERGICCLPAAAADRRAGSWPA